LRIAPPNKYQGNLQSVSAGKHVASMAWQQVWDEEREAHFYWNEETDETCWEQPEGFDGHARPDEIVIDDAMRASLACAAADDAGAWAECFDEASRAWFYYNKVIS
jgi:hypothetical protein